VKTALETIETDYTAMKRMIDEVSRNKLNNRKKESPRMIE
jgi:hypothetical protein